MSALFLPSGANLSDADLSEANLYQADLSEINLTGVRAATGEQLDRARSLEATILPDGSMHE